ncbi:hypothetical protein SAMN02745166_03505 [Prosthecobacter debontii]|uniref:Uncharacterized protein n=1 Tax=Prosthecobacter debontii TaxID=48467 RepID=A0A1T4YKX4_9BACT|nr:hypothetical protein [Prosthecobacter debontii]SKB01911.1 hypothetical protein SAMN02745166_03505 [Prosthecobacter debontii]
MPDKPSPADIQLKGIVDASTRYSGAYAEINTRITQRQNVITIFLTAITALVASAVVSLNSVHHLGLWRVIYGVPLLIIVFTALLRMHERQIVILRAYIAELEAFCEAAQIPNYHYNSVYISPAMEARRRHDLICFLLCLCAVVGALWICLLGWTRSQLSDLEVGIGGFWMAIGMIAALHILSTHRMRRDLLHSFGKRRS